MKMSSRTLALMLISALVVSSISLAVSVTSRSVPEAQEHASIPPEAFTGLGSKKGVGFGDWKLARYTRLYIFQYPDGYEISGWDGYLVDMLITITVQLDTGPAGGAPEGVAVQLDYLRDGNVVRTEVNFTNFPQCVTFTGQICMANVYNNDQDPSHVWGGHYFVSADRRV